MHVHDEKVSSLTELRHALRGRARVPLIHGPTPLEPLPVLSKLVSGPEIWIKREDCTGFALGGNKGRKLEYSVGHAVQSGADTLVTVGAIQSNHARQTAAAARRVGMGCHMVLEDRIGSLDETYRTNGNFLLDQLLGATNEIHEKGQDINAICTLAMERLRDSGKHPYFVPGGASDEHGSLGYVACVDELIQQFSELQMSFDAIVLASGSGGTQAGLVAGLALAKHDLPVYGFSVRRVANDQAEVVHDLAVATCEHLGANVKIPFDTIQTNSDHIGAGYGYPTHGSLQAVSMMAQSEAILIDQIYTGKALDGLIEMSKIGQFKPHHRVLFLHTGGAPALFAHPESITSHVSTLSKRKQNA